MYTNYFIYLFHKTNYFISLRIHKLGKYALMNNLYFIV